MSKVPTGVKKNFPLENNVINTGRTGVKTYLYSLNSLNLSLKTSEFKSQFFKINSGLLSLNPKIKVRINIIIIIALISFENFKYSFFMTRPYDSQYFLILILIHYFI